MSEGICWEEVFERYKGSGLSQPEFCRQNNLSNNQFQYRWYVRNKSLKAQEELPQEDNTITVTYTRNKPKRRTLPADLPRDVIEHDIPEHDKREFWIRIA